MREQQDRQARLLKQLNSKQRQSNQVAEQLLGKMLQEQRRTNQLLSVLIEALADDYSEPDAEPQTYMDGTPV